MQHLNMQHKLDSHPGANTQSYKPRTMKTNFSFDKMCNDLATGRSTYSINHNTIEHSAKRDKSRERSYNRAKLKSAKVQNKSTQRYLNP